MRVRHGLVFVIAVAAGGLACTQDFATFEGELASTPVDSGADQAADALPAGDSGGSDSATCTSAPQSCLQQRTTCRTNCEDANTACEDACGNGGGCKQQCRNTRDQCRTGCDDSCRTCGGTCTVGCS